MVSAKQPSQLWQIGRPSGPISLALISVRILTSARDVNSRPWKEAMNHDQRYQATRNRNPFSCLEEKGGRGWMNISGPLFWSGLVLAGRLSLSLCFATRGPSAGFPSPLVLKVKGLGAVFSDRIAVLAWILILATHTRNTHAGAHTYMQTTHGETTGTTAEQEVVGISRKYHKMVAKAIFFSFFVELNNKMRTNQRCLYQVVFHFTPPSPILLPFYGPV